MIDDPSRNHPAHNRRAAILSLAVLLVLAAAALAQRFILDSWLARFDMYTFFVPWYAHLGERLRALDVPGWNPHLFSGTPFAGDPESGWMYLPAMLSFTLLPVLAGFKMLAALHVAIAGVGAWLLARALGLGPWAALVAGLAYVMAPLMQWSTYCCLVMNQFAVWIPWLLLGIELGLRSPTWRGRIAPWSLAALALSQQFAGFVGQGWVLGPLLVAAWVGYRTLLDPARPDAAIRRRLLAGLGAGAFAIGGGMALGAAGILPRLDFNAQSNVPFGDYSGNVANAVLNPPWSVPHLLAQVMGSGYDRRSAAIGGATLVLAMLAVPLARRRFAAPFFAGLAFVCALLTLPDTPLHHVVYLIPGMESFHAHDAWRIWTLAPICFAMLAGIAVERMTSLRGNRRLLAIAPIPLLLMALAAWLIAPREGFIGWPPLVAAALMTLAIAAWAGLQGGGSAWLPAAAAALIFLQPIGFDMASAAFGLPEQQDWESRWHPDPIVRAMLDSEASPSDPGGAGEYLQQRMAEDGPFRYVGYGGVGWPGANQPSNYMARRFEPGIHAILVNGRPMFLRLNETQGYNPLQLGRYPSFVAAMNGAEQDYHTAYLLASGVSSPLLDLLDARFVLIDRAIPADRADVRSLQQGRREVFRDDLVSVWERDPAQRHAWIVHNAEQTTRDDGLARLAAGTADGAVTAMLETAPPPLEQPPAGSVEKATVTRYGPDALEIATSSAAQGLLIVSEAYDRGWKTAIDGRPAPTLPADGWLRAVPLPAGEHVVTMRYDPLSLRAGLWITAIAALLMLAGSIWSLAGRRGRPD